MKWFKKPTIIETIRLNRLCWFGHVQRVEGNRIHERILDMNFGKNKIERQNKKQMARGSERGWKNSWWRRLGGKRR